ncbi:MAG: excinuclease ABC subunit C, partial [Acidimicrobiales bacterium]|nr:excinuclease ABC subunit C [Acidimicrobiales bacterium]
DQAEDLTAGELVDRVLERLYGERPVLGVPKQVLVPDEPAEPALYEEWLTHERGSAVQIRVPQRGDKRALLATVTQNATEELQRHRLKRASDHNSRAKALNEL